MRLLALTTDNISQLGGRRIHEKYFIRQQCRESKRESTAPDYHRPRATGFTHARVHVDMLSGCALSLLVPTSLCRRLDPRQATVDNRQRHLPRRGQRIHQRYYSTAMYGVEEREHSPGDDYKPATGPTHACMHAVLLLSRGLCSLSSSPDFAVLSAQWY
jgi:hypothetical protein